MLMVFFMLPLVLFGFFPKTALGFARNTPLSLHTRMARFTKALPTPLRLVPIHVPSIRQRP
jgi:hypothetical protein